MLKTRVTLLHTSPKIPLHQLICGILFSLTTYQHSRLQGKSNLNQPCLQQFWNETKLLQRWLETWFEACFYNLHLLWALLYPEKSERFAGQRNRGKNVAFGTDLIPWDGVMGWRKGPMHHRPGNLGVNSKHRGERAVQTPGTGTVTGTGAAHGYQRSVCATGRGKEANCPSTTSPHSISK